MELLANVKDDIMKNGKVVLPKGTYVVNYTRPDINFKNDDSTSENEYKFNVTNDNDRSILNSISTSNNVDFNGDLSKFNYWWQNLAKKTKTETKRPFSGGKTRRNKRKTRKNKRSQHNRK